MLNNLVDECVAYLNRGQIPAKLLEALVSDLSESEVFPGERPDRAPIGLYVHIPFCATKCSFCGYSVELDRSAPLKAAYAKAVRAHLQRLAPYLSAHELTWVSFGGGTPSSLSPEELGVILDGISDFRRSRALSISMEMRVDSLQDDGRLAGYVARGVNRVCLGVQSFDDDVRRSFALRPRADEAYALLESVRAAGIEYAFDVIWGGPHQTRRDLDVTLDRVFELEPHQIDAYPLFPIRGTSMFKRFERVDRDALKAHHRVLCDHLVTRLARAGYQRIDGVMFSRTKDLAEDPRGGFREASSLLVPETGHIVGVGQSAHSLYAGTFATNPYSARKYVEKIELGEELVYTGIRAPVLIDAFRRVIAQLTRDRPLGAVRARDRTAPSAEELARAFYSIRFWWHVFTGLRGWNALSNKVGYPIGNEKSVRAGAQPRYVTAAERARACGAPSSPQRRAASLPILDEAAVR
jgi:oxygen-independent coproporphyrinogen-3 oxidase